MTKLRAALDSCDPHAPTSDELIAAILEFVPAEDRTDAKKRLSAFRYRAAAAQERDELGATPKQRRRVNALIKFDALRAEGWDVNAALAEVARLFRDIQHTTLERICLNRNDRHIFALRARMQTEQSYPEN